MLPADHGCLRTGAAALLAVMLVLALGPAVAAQEDPRDLEHIRALIDQALETEKSGVRIRWANPETGHTGIFVVERTFYRGDDKQPCRAYRRTIETGVATPLVIRGTGCRIGRGRWELEDERPVAASPAPARAPAASTKVEPEPAAPPEEPDPPAKAAAAAAEPPVPPPDPPPPAFPTFTLPARTAL